MTGTVLFSVPKVMTVTHYPEAKAVVAAWASLSSPKFREVVERGLNECGRLGAPTWIIDLTSDPGVPAQTDLKWVETDGVAMAKRNGIRAIVNVHGSSVVASMGPKRWNKSASEGGLSTYDCGTLADALALAGDIASGRAA